jgi:hypothetical protein
MGFGKFLKAAVTQTIKCDYCGRVISDGHYYGPLGEGYSKKAYDAQLSVFELVVHGAKKHTFCSKMCEMSFKNSHQLNEIMQQDIERNNQVTGNQANNSFAANSTASFCSNCGGALKQNARFCSKCGNSIN